MINSCQSVTPERSLLTTSHHCSGAPPGGLLLPLGRHFNTCFWMRLSGILQICPSHCRRLCFSLSSTGSSPVLSRIPVFRSMFQRVTPRTSLNHLIWNVFSFRMSCWVTGQVSALYKRTDITKVRKARILVVMLMFLHRVPFFSTFDTLDQPSLASLRSPFSPCLTDPPHFQDRERTAPLPGFGLVG